MFNTTIINSFKSRNATKWIFISLEHDEVFDQAPTWKRTGTTENTPSGVIGFDQILLTPISPFVLFDQWDQAQHLPQPNPYSSFGRQNMGQGFYKNMGPSRFCSQPVRTTMDKVPNGQPVVSSTVLFNSCMLYYGPGITKSLEYLVKRDREREKRMFQRKL